MTHLVKANNEAKKELTLSSIFNKLQSKADGSDKDNFIIKAFRLLEADNMDMVLNFIRQGKYEAFKTVIRPFIDKDRKTGVEGKTWNLWTKVENKEPFSWYMLSIALCQWGNNIKDHHKGMEQALKLKPAPKTRKA